MQESCIVHLVFVRLSNTSGKLYNGRLLSHIQDGRALFLMPFLEGFPVAVFLDLCFLHKQGEGNRGVALRLPVVDARNLSTSGAVPRNDHPCAERSRPDSK